MKTIIILFFATCIVHCSSTAQFSTYIIRFKDKNGTLFSTSDPAKYLSPRSIERRRRQQIQIDETDLPVNQNYLDGVRLAGAVTIVNSSKWLNQVCIQTTDNNALTKIRSLPFVLSAQPLRRPAVRLKTPEIKEEVGTASPHQLLRAAENNYYNYGSSYAQINIHEGEFLHNKGFRGQGMLMAIMDAGFYHYKSITAFDSVNLNNQVAETYDFVKNETSVDEDDTHGMFCFSIIAANWPALLTGSCPKAIFYLYRTEDAATEFPVEEQNWAAAAERADSIGVDVFSTSLGYTTFDNSIFDHSYADMDGNTTLITRACDLAAKKGIISVVAAGNEGNSAWHFISAPADADSALTVGAVDASGNVAGFSSYGPSADGNVKPDVASVGQGTAVANTNNQPAYGNGTSFATPNLAGLVTCLWQAYPDFTNMEIIDAVTKSSNTYKNPDTRIGYGIPNFRKAFEDLFQRRALKNLPAILINDWIKVFPNPFTKTFYVALKPVSTGTVTFKLFDNTGKLYLTKKLATQVGQPQFIPFEDLQPLAKGVYILQYDDGQAERSIPLIGQ